MIFSPADIEGLRALCAKATPGEWTAESFTRYENDPIDLRWRIFLCGAKNPRTNSRDCDWTKDDAAFIAAARSALPSLLDALTQALKERDEACQDAERAWAEVSKLGDERRALAKERDEAQAATVRSNRAWLMAAQQLQAERDEALAELARMHKVVEAACLDGDIQVITDDEQRRLRDLCKPSGRLMTDGELIDLLKDTRSGLNAALDEIERLRVDLAGTEGARRASAALYEAARDERDAARVELAALKDSQRAERLRDEAHQYADAAQADNERLRAECESMRPVVEAAIVYRNDYPAAPTPTALTFITAVNAYRASKDTK